MKKTFLLSCILSLICVGLSANDDKAKKDVKEYLPQAGDVGLSVNANPFLSFMGNFFNGSTDNGVDSFGGQTYNLSSLHPFVSISGKYMLTDNIGLRVNLGWMHDGYSRNYYVTDQAELAVNPLSEKKLIDTYTTKNSGGSFSAAIEYRVGKRRVQGIFGGGLLYAFDYDREKYSYGNAITDLNQSPETEIQGSSVGNPPNGFSYMRYTSRFTNTPTHYAGLIAFVGVEWFVAPKISLGGEVNIAAAYNWTQATYYTAEGFNTLSNQVETWTELETPSSHGFSFGTGNFGANISVNFYF